MLCRLPNNEEDRVKRKQRDTYKEQEHNLFKENIRQ